jgi:histidyl-tRNA synthetase
MELTPVRGTQDLLPPAGGRMRALYDRAARLARLYGYRYVETPALEPTDLFVATSGQSSDVVSKEMYTFTDRGGRSLTLRPEGTAPVMRAYLADQHDQASPFKAYYLTRMYRYGRPQAGRYREHRQFGIEVFGVEGPAADVEVIVVGDRYLRELGLTRYRLEINSIGDETCRPGYRELLLSYLRAHREQLRDEHRDRFEMNPLRVLDCKDDACRAVAAGAPKLTDHLCDPCREHFDGVLAGLDDARLKATITPTLVRGLDYYTRTAFEFASDVLSEAQATLFGGGRYDGLAQALGGPHVPGVGFGMGLERVLLALEDEGVTPPEETGIDCFVVAIGEGARAAAGPTANALRTAGLATTSSYDDRPLKGQLRTADRLGARFAMILGDREVAAGRVTIRRMQDGEQRVLGIDRAIAWVKAGDEVLGDEGRVR